MPYLIDRSELARSIDKYNGLSHLFVGTLLGILLFVLVIMFYTHEFRATVAYAGFVFFSLLSVLFLNGFFFVWLQGHVRPIEWSYMLIFTGLTANYLWLAKSYFNTAYYFPRINQFLKINIVLAAMICFSPLVLPFHHCVTLLIITSSLWMFMLAILCLYLWHKHPSASIFYVAGTMLFLLTALIALLTVNGLVGYQTTLRYTYDTGICLQALCFSLAVADLTNRYRGQKEQHKLDAELAHREGKAKSEFLAKMSHEIRTPMNGMLGMLELLYNGELDDTQREQVDIVRSSGQTLLSIINDVLDYAKIDAGKLTIEDLPTPIHRVLKEVVLLFENTALEKNITLELRVAPSIPETIRADPTRLKQIIINLLSNALKFTDKGHVRLNADLVIEGEKNWVKITISDTGIGIKPQQQKNLFQSFSQADSSINRRFGGTGLGLAISQQLVHLMGGKIQCHSTWQKGSQFSFDLAISTPTTAPTTPQPDLSSLLLFSHHPFLIDTLCEYARANQFTIEVENSTQALVAVAKKIGQYDCVILDIDSLSAQEGFSNIIDQCRILERITPWLYLSNSPRRLVLKWTMSDVQQEKYELLLAVMGSAALGWEKLGYYSAEQVRIAQQWAFTKAYSIGGGTTEIQLNIIAKRVLGLPDV